MIRKIKYSILTACAIVICSSCEEYLSTGSSTALEDTEILSSTSNLKKVLVANYRKFYFMTVSSDFRGIFHGITGLAFIDMMRGTDVICQNRMGGEQYTAYQYLQEATSSAGDTDCPWTVMYNIINSANLIINAVETASGTQTDKDQLLGQSLAMRGYCYFMLIQYYQQTYVIAQNKLGVPLRLKAPDDGDYTLPRATVQEVYTQIVSDLTSAKSLLSSFSRSEKYHLDSKVVSGMLARVYLVMQKYSEAQAEADNVLATYGTLMTKEEWQTWSLSLSFAETVWGFPQTSTNSIGAAGQYGMWYNYPLGEQAGDRCYNFQNFFANDKYVELFEETEDRYLFWLRSDDPEFATNWVYAKWYDPGDGAGNSRGDYCLMRGAEMLLIKAECQANLGNTGDALASLNKLQEARHVTNKTTTTDKNALLEAIYIERRKELMGEGFSGLLDLLRLQKPMIRRGDHFIPGIVNLPALEDGNGLPSNDYRMIFQIPDRELQLNPGITQADQNPFSGQ